MPEIPNDEKFRELILFIAEESEGDRAFGATKLNKILFYSDFNAYLHFGSSITGQEYQALKNGPAPRLLLPIMEQLESSNAIAIKERRHFGWPQKRTVALREPNLELFSAKEIKLVCDLIEELWDKTATQLSDLSHEFIGWELAEEGETIPYEVTLVGNRSPSKVDIEHCERAVAVAESWHSPRR